MVRDVPVILEALANPLRARVILSLERRDTGKYSDLLNDCSLDPYSESGKLGYHLQQLISLGLVSKDVSIYALTDKGRKASRLLEIVNEAAGKLWSTEDKPKICLDKVIVREATYRDLPRFIKLWRESLHMKDPDYFIAELIAGREGIQKKALLHQGYGKGRFTIVAEHEDDLIGCCIVDLMSIVHMKAEFAAAARGEKVSTVSKQDREFHQRYWQVESEFIAAHSEAVRRVESKYGVFGTWSTPFEPMELTFTRRTLEGGEFVTSELDEIFDKVLSSWKLATDAYNARENARQAMDGDNPPACFEIFKLVAHPDAYGVETTILEYLEDEATKRGIKYIVTRENPEEKEARDYWKGRGFTEIHQPSFRYKNAGRVETFLLIKKL